MSLEVKASIESDEDGIFGEAMIESIDFIADWEYDADKNVVKLNGWHIEGKYAPSIDPEDPLLDMVHSRITDAVTAYLGRAELAAEEAKDSAVDMAIDNEIEKRHDGIE